jgi:hypothetical protein
MSRQKPVTPLFIRPCVYRLAIDMRKAFPTRPGIGVWEREVRGLIKAPRRLGRFQPCDIRRFPSLVMTFPFTRSIMCPAADVSLSKRRASRHRDRYLTTDGTALRSCGCRIEVGVTSG